MYRCSCCWAAYAHNPCYQVKWHVQYAVSGKYCPENLPLLHLYSKPRNAPTYTVYIVSGYVCIWLQYIYMSHSGIHYVWYNKCFSILPMPQPTDYCCKWVLVSGFSTFTFIPHSGVIVFGATNVSAIFCFVWLPHRQTCTCLCPYIFSGTWLRDPPQITCKLRPAATIWWSYASSSLYACISIAHMHVHKHTHTVPHTCPHVMHIKRSLF